MKYFKNSNNSVQYITSDDIIYIKKSCKEAKIFSFIKNLAIFILNYEIIVIIYNS